MKVSSMFIYQCWQKHAFTWRLNIHSLFSDLAIRNKTCQYLHSLILLQHSRTGHNVGKCLFQKSCLSVSIFDSIMLQYKINILYFTTNIYFTTDLISTNTYMSLMLFLLAPIFYRQILLGLVELMWKRTSQRYLLKCLRIGYGKKSLYNKCQDTLKMEATSQMIFLKNQLLLGQPTQVFFFYCFV